VGNRKLSPEKASQFNLGATWSGVLWSDRIDYASISVDGYANLVKDKIVAIPTMFIWRMMNMGKVAMGGADVNGSAVITLPEMMSLSLNANYSLQYAVDISDPESKTYLHQIPYTPRHSGSVTLSWKSRWLNVSYLCVAVGERYSFPQNTRSNLIEGYFDHSVTLRRAFEVGEHTLSLVAEVLNISDVNYEVVQYYPMPGRSYKLTLKYKF
jgi:outer membrane receptor protein involved in Fe transport